MNSKLLKVIVMTIFSFFFLSTVAFAQEIKDKPLLYVRKGCPHCAKVEAFLNKYNLNDKVEKIETFNNEEKAKELDSWFKKLNVTDSNQMGVPFLVVDEKTYFVGDVPIIDYLAKQNNITVEPEVYQSSTADMIFLGLGGLVLFGVLGYGIYTSIKKKD